MEQLPLAAIVIGGRGLVPSLETMESLIGKIPLGTASRGVSRALHLNGPGGKTRREKF